MKYLGLGFLLVLIIGGGFVYWNYFFAQFFLIC